MAHSSEYAPEKRLKRNVEIEMEMRMEMKNSQNCASWLLQDPAISPIGAKTDCAEEK